jgi:hypothetical protein
VHLSIGGNDVLGDWKVSMRPGQVDTLKSRSSRSTRHYHHLHQSGEARCAQSFGAATLIQTLGKLSMTFPAPTSHPFYNAWQKMELPTFEQINNMLV